MNTKYGDGSVYQRTSDGRWVAAVVLPYGRGEIRRRKCMTATTREGAIAKLDDYRQASPAHSTPGLGRAAYMEIAKALGDHREADWWRLWRKGDQRCHYCRRVLKFRDVHRDHMIPVSRRGSNAIENVVGCCPDCNNEKGTMTAAEYFAFLDGRNER